MATTKPEIKQSKKAGWSRVAFDAPDNLAFLIESAAEREMISVAAFMRRLTASHFGVSIEPRVGEPT